MAGSLCKVVKLYKRHPVKFDFEFQMIIFSENKFQIFHVYSIFSYSKSGTTKPGGHLDSCKQLMDPLTAASLCMLMAATGLFPVHLLVHLSIDFSYS
jgi:hypothetical protein